MTNLTIEEARAALAEAEAADARRLLEARRDAERAAQADHDRKMTSVVADLEAHTATVIADAKKLEKTAVIGRDASVAARRYLLGLNHDIGPATANDPAAATLAGHAQRLATTYERHAAFGSPQARAGERRIGPDLAQRLADAERITWGALLRRLRTIAGE